MRSELVDALVVQVADEDIERLTDTALGEEIVELRRAIDRFEFQCSRRLDLFARRQGYVAFGFVSLISRLPTERSPRRTTTTNGATSISASPGTACSTSKVGSTPKAAPSCRPPSTRSRKSGSSETSALGSSVAPTPLSSSRGSASTRA